MTTAPSLIIEFPATRVPDAAAARTVVAAARSAAAVAGARSVPLLLPETADGGGPAVDPGVLAGILATDLLGPNAGGSVVRSAGAPPRLIVTAGTSRNAPYNLARRIHSLNRITCGKVGLFLRADGLDPVTSGSLADPGAADPVRLLAEYVAVLRKLWVSFPEEALIGDREAGRFADPRSLVPASFAGDVYSVAGALNVPLPSAHRTLLLTDATAPAGAVEGIISPVSGASEAGTVPAYRTVSWNPSSTFPSSTFPSQGEAPAVTGARGIEVTGTADDAARVLLDEAPNPVLLRVRAEASQLAGLLVALFEALPHDHETRELHAHAG